ncbi:hypothetical protein NUU61_007543 [Penicillium alfredii]|uniref:Major facilitator superfamily (MFS) profile domain-containing protein n=1 Tax=Penicillium alfredii TaxID=1506179 RepID=A0A9W9JYN5_9EURO|nr:uncharacterized protein NUU61_007543 [Penicillium alfredii]KAJ5086236.1 hypothetical protein NUU61_007543 [Penicillium alfredii]
MSFSSGAVNTLTPYVTGVYKEHSLTATTTILFSLVGALIKLPYAKMLDIWGRPQSFAVMTGCMTLGLVMMAACNSVEMYCAAQVFYPSPYIVTTWAYGPAVSSILATTGIPWGFGIFSIVTPVMCLPLFYLFYYNQSKAEKAGLISKSQTDRTLWQSIIHYGKEFDVIGLQDVEGPIDHQLFDHRTRLARGICPLREIPGTRHIHFMATVDQQNGLFHLCDGCEYIYTSWYLWDSYFWSMLIVVFSQSTTHATYISNIYTIGSCFWSVVVGIIIRFNGRLKWHALYFGAPLSLLEVGLMIKFCEAGVNIGYIIMCQISIAFGGGTLVIREQMTIMAVSSQQDTPSLLAMESMFINIEQAVGSTIAATLWQGIFPVKLQEYLPADAMSNFAQIYGKL